MNRTIVFAVGFVLVVLGGAYWWEHTLSRAKVEPVKNADNQISDEFREVAGDAFDKVLALQTAELKGKLFYEPILHEADLAVIKANRKASNNTEKFLAVEIDLLKEETKTYRSSMEILNSCGITNCTSEERKGWLALVQKYEKEQKDFNAAISESLKKP